MVIQVCNPSYLEGSYLEGVGGTWSEAVPAQMHETLSEKQTEAKRTGGMAQVIKPFPSMCEALRSNISTAKKKLKVSYLQENIHLIGDTNQKSQLGSSLTDATNGL
jgi:hypothetical protein